MADPVPAKKRREIDDDDIGLLDSIRNFFTQGARGNTKDIVEKGGPGGQARRRKIDDIVDQAVKGAKEDPY
jgi:hypothetical protein